jgi:hypothetical protein
MIETVARYAKATPHVRLVQRTFFEKSGLPTLSIKPAWHEEGFLVGFEVWDGPDLVGYIPYGKEFRNMLFDVGIG